MATVYDVNTNKLLENVSKELEKLSGIKAPDWASFVKTGPAKDRPPVEENWWYVRAASILRTIYRSKGPIGVQKLRVRYGSKKNRGHKPGKFYRASGKIIRLIIQQLEKEQLIKQAEVGVHKGRIIAPKGKSLLDKAASKIAGETPKKEAPKKETKTDDKKAEPKKEEKKTETVDKKDDKVAEKEEKPKAEETAKK